MEGEGGWAALSAVIIPLSPLLESSPYTWHHLGLHPWTTWVSTHQEKPPVPQIPTMEARIQHIQGLVGGSTRANKGRGAGQGHPLCGQHPT